MATDAFPGPKLNRMRPLSLFTNCIPPLSPLLLKNWHFSSSLCLQPEFWTPFSRSWLLLAALGRFIPSMRLQFGSHPSGAEILLLLAMLWQRHYSLKSRKGRNPCDISVKPSLRRDTRARLSCSAVSEAEKLPKNWKIPHREKKAIWDQIVWSQSPGIWKHGWI